MYNAGLPQQNFNNAVTKAGGKAGVLGQKAAGYTNEADRNQQGWQNIISGGAVVAGGAASKSDERSKKDVRDVEEIDMDAFLATLSPKKFRYKDKADGDGDRTGVMAQDLLKSDLGADLVVEMEPGTLGYDNEKMQGVLIAAIKHLSDKIDKKGS
jgi:hypothetical protein